MATDTRLRLSEIEKRVCDIAAEELRIARNQVTPSARILEDLHVDSLDLVELVMNVEEAFDVTLPDDGPNPVYKAVFTRQPFRLADLAELVYLQQGSGRPERAWWSRAEAPPASAGFVPFTQLDGRCDWRPGDRAGLVETLKTASPTRQFRRRSDGMCCALIPATTVELGCDRADARPDEQPQHVIELDAFLIDLEPVSTTAYCRFLNGEVSESFLPSEAQWEYAARGPVFRSFPCGDEPPSPERMQYGRHCKSATYRAESLPMANVNDLLGMSPFGLHHMAGNVWQWCRDWYDADFHSRPEALTANPVNRRATGVRTERGGSWIGPADLCRSSFRRARPPSAKGRCLGFRCVGPAQ